MGIEYGPAIDMFITDSAWIFTDALKGLTGEQLSIVLHKTACNGPCSAQSTAQFFAGDTTNHKSVHFVIGLDGAVVHVVHLQDGAGGNCCLESGHDSYWDGFASQYGNLNRCSISIEHVDQTIDNSQPMTPEQIAASFALVAWLVQKFSIPVSHIKTHASLDPVSRARCPGPTYPLADLIAHIGGHMQPWYTFPIVVPFGNPSFDSVLGGAHDLDIGAPPNYPVTNLLPGTVASITEPPPAWGKQIGIKLDSPVNGVPYFAFLHLSAINPALAVGQHVGKDALIGWVGGATQASQYNGTSNPTGQNFLNDTFNSSRIQVGVALMRGPEYGKAGWESFPPVDWALDPSPIIKAAVAAYNNAAPPASTSDFKRKAFEAEWQSVVKDAMLTSGIANQAWADYQAGNGHGPALSEEFHVPDWSTGTLNIGQIAGNGIYIWAKDANGTYHAHYHPYK